MASGHMQLNWSKADDFLRGSFCWPDALLPWMGVVTEGEQLSDGIGKLYLEYVQLPGA